MTVERLAQPLDANSRAAIGLVVPGYVDNLVLTAGVAKTYTIPTGAKVLNFSANADFYVDFLGGTAAVPTADVTDGSGVVLNPGMRSGLTAADTISIISPGSCIVTIEVCS
jgi:hypothetical protein